MSKNVLEIGLELLLCTTVVQLDVVLPHAPFAVDLLRSLLASKSTRNRSKWNFMLFVCRGVFDRVLSGAGTPRESDGQSRILAGTV